MGECRAYPLEHREAANAETVNSAWCGWTDLQSFFNIHEDSPALSLTLYALPIITLCLS